MNDDEYILIATQKANAIRIWLQENGWANRKPFPELPDHVAANIKCGCDSLADKIYDLLEHLLTNQEGKAMKTIPDNLCVGDETLCEQYGLDEIKDRPECKSHQDGSHAYPKLTYDQRIALGSMLRELAGDID